MSNKNTHLLASQRTEKNFKKQFYMSFFLVFVAIYMLFYVWDSFIYYNSEGLNMVEFLSDKFSDRLLLLLIVLLCLVVFFYFFQQKNRSIISDFQQYIVFDSVNDTFTIERRLIKTKRTKSGETIHENIVNSGAVIPNCSKITHFRQEIKNYTSRNSTVELSDSGTTTIGGKIGTPLNLNTKTINFSTYKNIAVYADKTEIIVSTDYPISQALNQLFGFGNISSD